MAPRLPTSLSLYETTTQARLQKYESHLQRRTYRPFIYPWDSLPVLWLLLALLIFPRLPQHILKYTRLPVCLLIFGHCIYVGRSCRTIGFAGGYGIGLAAMWGCIASIGLLGLKDLRKDFERLEVRSALRSSKDQAQTNGTVNVSRPLPGGPGDIRKRKGAATGENGTSKSTINATRYDQLVWTKCPSSLYESIDFCLDLVTSFRGTNWNFRNPTIPPLPSNITSNAYPPPLSAINKIRLTALRDFTLLYITVDLVKSLAIRDPYFLGLAPLSSPSPFALLRPHTTLTRFTRLLLSAIATNTTLNLIFTLSPLLFPLIPQLQHLTRTPLQHPAMYPPYSHPLIPTIVQSGLAGFWGKFWHQLFRYGISQPGLYITTKLKLERKSAAARAIQVFIAFSLSGCIHAAASYTSFPPAANVSRPISGPWMFFVLQALGIVVSDGFCQVVKSKRFPLLVRQLGNILFTGLWLYCTGPLLADDFARCGVWLFEPLPVSFARGAMGEGWWKWGGRWAGWSGREEWWMRGLAVY